VTSLSVVRPEKAPSLGPDAVDLMGLLLPHLKCALRIHHTMEFLRTTAAAAIEAIDAAIVAIDGKGEVLMASKKAETILRQGDGICLRNRRISATDMRESRELDALILSAACTGAGTAVHPGGSLLLHRRTRRPLQVSVVPFHSSHMLTEVRPCAIILISDPDTVPASRTKILASLYRLTPAECRLADLLLHGLSVAVAAESMKITTGTARFMLKSIFEKTGTHRQAELMRFLLVMPGAEVRE
jgi:DNA-binding CsgD family transcriptional regulator